MVTPRLLWKFVSGVVTQNSLRGVQVESKPSTHITAEVVHAHTWDLTLKTQKTDLSSSHQMILISLDDLDIFTWVPIYTSALLQNLGLTPKFYGQLQKRGLWLNPNTPKTILGRNSAYNLCAKTAELPKLRTFKVAPQQAPKTHQCPVPGHSATFLVAESCWWI